MVTRTFRDRPLLDLLLNHHKFHDLRKFSILILHSDHDKHLTLQQTTLLHATLYFLCLFARRTFLPFPGRDLQCSMVRSPTAVHMHVGTPTTHCPVSGAVVCSSHTTPT